MNLEVKSASYRTAMEMYGKKMFEEYMHILADPATFLLETVCYKNHQKAHHAAKKAKKEPNSVSRVPSKNFIVAFPYIIIIPNPRGAITSTVSDQGDPMPVVVTGDWPRFVQHPMG